ncbi:MAG: M48 family metallopeptidase [Alphaproteobacteria bacterium]|nr:M48 family metallopeptidase [Alphaproteobacteria bacterium]
MSAPSSAPVASGLASTDFMSAQRRNRRMTRWLLIVLTLIAAGLGASIGAMLEFEGGTASDALSALTGPAAIAGAMLLGLASLLWSGITLALGDRLLAGISGAREVGRENEPQLHNIVEEMAIAAGLPKPKVLVIETEVPNAFATGMRTSRAAIGVTRGLLDSLSRTELQGVIGHEMGHIANLDTRYMTAVGVTVGLIAMVSEIALRAFRWGSFGRSRSSAGDNKKGGGQLILIVVFLVFAILAPIAAKFVQFAVSRQREYLADATSVQFTRNPEGLIGALRKLTEAAKPFPGVSGATQHLFIINPLRQFTSRTWSLLATHPALEDRIARLENLGA